MASMCSMRCWVTMTQVMAPFTPFFSEYLYQTLRKFQPLYGNTDPAVRDDVLGKSESVHFLMLPVPEESPSMNKLAVDRFATLQQAVVQARVAGREDVFDPTFLSRMSLWWHPVRKMYKPWSFYVTTLSREINVWNVEFSTDFIQSTF